MKKKLILIMPIVIVLVLLATLGVSVAIFSTRRLGIKETNIEIGDLTFKYTEDDGIGNGIILEDTEPMADAEGKLLDTYFDFKVAGKLTRSSLKYDVEVETTEDTTINLNGIKVYITEVVDGVEKDIDSNYDNNGKIKTLSDYNDLVIYEEVVARNTKNYEKNFRVRIWIDEDVDIYTNEYMGASGGFKINVNANSDISDIANDTTTSSDTRVLRIEANNDYIFTTSNDEKIDYEVSVPYTVDEIEINVVPESTKATYEIEEIGIQELANSETFSLTVGDNYYKATVTSSDGKENTVYKLKVTRIDLPIDTVTLLAKSQEYTGSPIAANTASSVTGGQITYIYYDNTDCTGNEIQVPTNVGEYSVKAISAGKHNEYHQDSICVEHTITANTNNNLASLTVTGYAFNETFDANTTSYTLTTEEESITINATAAGAGATVTGAGEKNLSWGQNQVFTIKVTSQANVDKVYTITVNNVRPTAPTIAGGSSDWTSTSRTISISTEGTAVSNVDHYEYYKTQSSIEPTDQTNKTGNGNSIEIIDEGTTYVYFRTVSVNGNKSVWSSSQIVKKDSSAPTNLTITISDGKASDSWHTSSYTLTFSATKNGSSEVKYYYGETSSPNTPGTSIEVDSNTSGITYYIKACNEANVCSGNKSYIAKLDTSTPAAPGVTGGSTTWTTSKTFILTNPNSTSGISTYQYYVSNSTTKPSASTTPTKSLTNPSFDVATNGQYIFFRVINNAETKGEWSNAYNLYIDTTNYKITYNLNSGTNPTNAVNSFYVDTATFNLPTPTRNLYTFNGWYDNSSFSGNPITQIPVGTRTNKTYYAKWSQTTYSSGEPGLYSDSTNLMTHSWSDLEALGITKTSVERNYNATANDSLNYNIAASPSKIFRNNNLTGKLILSNSITKVGDRAFYSVTNISALTINANTTTIGTWAFGVPDSEVNASSPKLATLTFASGSKLTTIGDYAFCNNYKIQSLTIPNSVTSIGASAFQAGDSVAGTNVPLLSSLTLGTSLQTIGSAAFVNHPKLTSLTIPANVTTIGTWAFGIVSGVQSASAPQLATLTFASGSKLTTIGDYAFCNNYKIQNLTIPNSVTSIGNYAFFVNAAFAATNTPLLSTLTLGTGVQTIGEYAFAHHPKLTSLTIPANVTTIGDWAFGIGQTPASASAPQLATLTFASGSKLTTIGESAFCNNYKIQSLTIPNSVTSIGDSAFLVADSIAATNVPLLSSLTLGTSLQTIGVSAFGNHHNLTSLTIPASVTTIGNWAFGISDSVVSASVPQLATLTFAQGSKLTKIGDSAFRNQLKIQSIAIPNSVTSIGASAFFISPTAAAANIPPLATLTLGTGVQTIGEYAFSHHPKITSLTIPANVTTIGNWAFGIGDAPASASAPQLATLTFASGSKLTTIGEYAFCNNYKIQSLTIPNSVTSIGKYAFFVNSTYATTNTPLLSTLTLGTGVQTIGDYAFSHHPKITSLTIPANVTTIGTWAFGIVNGIASASASQLATLTFASGSKLTTIGNSAFYNQLKITSLTIPANVTTIGTWAFGAADSSLSVTASQLATLTFASGSKLTTIGENAFRNQHKIQSIAIPNSVTSIGDSAFNVSDTVAIANPPALSSLTIGTGLQAIGANVFYNRLKYASLTIPANVTTIGNWAFGIADNLATSSAPQLATLTFASGSKLTTIGASAFRNQLKIQSIAIPNSVTSIGNYAFNVSDSVAAANPPALSSLTLGTGLKTMGNYAFSNHPKVTSLTIPASLTSIGTSTFALADALITASAPQLATLTFASGSSITTIGENAFRNQNKIASIAIPNSVTSIGNNAFYVITSYAAANPPALTTVTLGTGLKTIGNTVFANCPKITSLTIPANVTTIGNWAFGVASDVVSQSNPQMNSLTFASGSKLEKIGSNAFYGQWKISTLSLPSTLKYIGTRAFVVPSSVTSQLSSVTFGTTSGWYATQTETDTTGTNLTLTNTTNNAKYLRSTYGAYYIKRN